MRTQRARKQAGDELVKGSSETEVGGGGKEEKRPDFLLSFHDPISRTCKTRRKARVLEHSTDPDHRKSPSDSNVLSIFYVRSNMEVRRFNLTEPSRTPIGRDPTLFQKRTRRCGSNDASECHPET